MSAAEPGGTRPGYQAHGLTPGGGRHQLPVEYAAGEGCRIILRAGLLPGQVGPLARLEITHTPPGAHETRAGGHHPVREGRHPYREAGSRPFGYQAAGVTPGGRRRGLGIEYVAGAYARTTLLIDLPAGGEPVATVEVTHTLPPGLAGGGGPRGGTGGTPGGTASGTGR